VTQYDIEIHSTCHKADR